jgi:hypothetical protein
MLNIFFACIIPLIRVSSFHEEAQKFNPARADANASWMDAQEGFVSEAIL